jgi:hypothetical protein
MSDPRRSESDEDEAFLRRLTFAEEDRPSFTTAKWEGGFRWFRSPNVVRLEVYRRPPPAAVSPNRPGAEVVAFRRKLSWPKPSA